MRRNRKNRWKKNRPYNELKQRMAHKFLQPELEVQHIDPEAFYAQPGSFRLQFDSGTSLRTQFNNLRNLVRAEVIMAASARSVRLQTPKPSVIMVRRPKAKQLRRERCARRPQVDGTIAQSWIWTKKKKIRRVKKSNRWNSNVLQRHVLTRSKQFD